jgi:hypothetical protein
LTSTQIPEITEFFHISKFGERISAPEFNHIRWDQTKMFFTSNFSKTIRVGRFATKTNPLFSFLHPVTAYLRFPSSEVLLLTAQELDSVLDAQRELISENSEISTKLLMVKREFITLEEFTATEVGLQLFCGQTTYPSEAHAELKALLGDEAGCEVAVRLVCGRGWQSQIAYSDLDKIIREINFKLK